jgi:hypothetical protein
MRGVGKFFGLFTCCISKEFGAGALTTVETWYTILSPNNLFAIDHLFAILSSELNSASNLLLLSLVFFV